MKFYLQIKLSLFDFSSSQDFWDLTKLLNDSSLVDYIEDSEFAKVIYFIKENNEMIGFVFFMQYKNSNVYNVEYDLLDSKKNNDYIYTVLTLIRDKIKSYSEIQNFKIISGTLKKTKNEEVASKFGEKIYTNEQYNYYEVNPNCEDLKEENQKILEYLKTFHSK